MERINHIHMIGIGGSGMSGIAEVLHNLGFKVSGSDLNDSVMTQHLSGLGIEITIGHHANNIKRRDVIVTSSAVEDDNPELIAARHERIPIIPRAEMLAELMRFRYGIAVAGTHGKTSTTSLIASLLAEGALDPTFVIGGRLNSAGSNARLGASQYLVAEADESDASFLYLQPMIAVVTNIDRDHMSTYDGDFDRLKNTFIEFLHHLPFYGLAVLCLDDENVRMIAEQFSKPVVTYGLTDKADIYAHDIVQQGFITHFKVSTQHQQNWLQVTLNFPGKHNVQNALAAIAVVRELGVKEVDILNGLAHFEGVGRRFQVNGEWRVNNRDILFIDDYGHHPCEIKATLDAVKAGWPERRLIVVFQPHRYTRTHDLYDDFVTVLADTDKLLLTEIYSAGETKISHIDSRSLSKSIRARGQVDPVFVEQLNDIPAILNGIMEDQDIVLTLGAGNIGSFSAVLPEKMAKGQYSS